MIKLKIVLFFFLFLTSFINGYKILLYSPKMGHSALNFMSQITKLLINAGHDVVVISSNIDPKLKDPYHLPGKIFFIEPSKEIVEMATNDEHVKNRWKSTTDIFGQRKMFKQMMESRRSLGIKIINDKKLEEFVLSQHFDLAIAESHLPYMFGLFKAWGIKSTIAASPTVMLDHLYELFGIPFPASYMPSIVIGSTDRMSYKERAINLATYIFLVHLSDFTSEYFLLNDVLNEKYGKGFYEGNKIVTEASFVLINSNPFLDIPGPKSPKMIEISGIGKPKPLPVDKYFDEILNRRNKTILISFGSVAKSTFMEQDMKDGILETIKSFPDITFIWKYETPEDGHGKDIENLVLSKWIPQNDLLSDKRLTLFITHGGMGSTTEVAFNDVPALAIPVFGDQMRNAKLLERLEIGIAVEKDILRHPKQLREKILEILNNEKYKINSIRTAAMLQNRPISSEELILKHVEFACRFGKLPMLDLASKDMGTIEYYNLDIIIPFFVVLIAILYGIIKLACKLISKIFFTKVKIE
uniref:glucuronosyltransferase n=1 Tax=Parastrongyloides trichosuri TaxID=131310 RepID=A0A0N5A000_PARTI